MIKRLSWAVVVLVLTVVFGPAAMAQCPTIPSACGPITVNPLIMGGPIYLDIWTSSTRPTSPQPGWFGYNTTIESSEFWNGATWVASGGGGGGGSPGLPFGSLQYNANGTLAGSSNASLDSSGNATFAGAVTGGTGVFGNLTATANFTGQTTQVPLATWAGFWIDPCWYGPGCVTDGTGDNEPAFQAAINAQPTGSNVTLHVHGPGTYNFQSATNNNGRMVNVLIDAGAHITGSGLNVYRVDRTLGALHASYIDTSGNVAFNDVNDTPNNNGLLEKIQVVATNHFQGEYNQFNFLSKDAYNTAPGNTFGHVNLINYQLGPFDKTDIFPEWNLYYCPQISDANYFTNGIQNEVDSCHGGEIDITNFSPSFGFTTQAGNSWSTRGRFFASQSGSQRLGGDVLNNWATGNDANGPNSQCPFYPCVYSISNPAAVTPGNSILVNGTTVTIGGAGALADVASAINAASISNILAGVSTMGSGFNRLWIANNLANATGLLALSNGTGTPLGTLGITAKTYTGDSFRNGGGTGSSPVMALSVSNPAMVLTAGNTIVVTLSGNSGSPSTLTVPGGGLTGAPAIAAWVNAFTIPGLTASTANGPTAAVAFLYVDPAHGANMNMTLANGTGTPLTTLGIASGAPIYISTPPAALATAWSWNSYVNSSINIPCTALPCSVTITPSDTLGNLGTPVPVTISSSGSNTIAGLVGAINAASIPNVTAAFAGSQGFVWIKIVNTAGGGFTIVDNVGTPLEALHMIPGPYQAGGYFIGAESGFMNATDSTAHNGVSFTAGGNIVGGLPIPYLPRNPFMAHAGYYDGIDMSLTQLTTGRAYNAAPSQVYAWNDGLQLSDCGMFMCSNTSPATTDNSLKLATTQMVQAAITTQIEANASATVPLGNGSDGPFSCSTGNPFFTHDMQNTSVAISGTCKVNTNNFKWFETGIGDISAAGNRAIYCTSVTVPATPTGTTGQTAGGSPATVLNPTLPVVVFTANPSTGYGGNSSTGAGSAASVVSNSSFYSNGGNGGAGGAGGGGSGGAGAAGSANLHSANAIPQSSPYTDFVTSNRNTAIDMLRPGYTGGGGGGGAGDGANAGGPGGASAAAGCTIELSWNIINRSSSTAVGAVSTVPSNSGNGGDSPGGNANGGGGGGGAGAGPIYVYFNTLTGTSATNLFDASGGLGGNGGAGTGTGAGGVAGTGGNSGYIQILQSNVTPFFSTWNQAGSAPTAPSGTTGGIGGAGAVLQRGL